MGCGASAAGNTSSSNNNTTTTQVVSNTNTNPNTSNNNNTTSTPDNATSTNPPKTSDSPQPRPIVTRREIRSLSPAEQQRFAGAMKKLMENRDGPNTSEYFRLAGYHGWPNDYCSHGRENFPGWHRIYLYDMEKALQKADKDLGGDGDIGLPYWDWTDVGPGNVIPQIVKDELSSFPSGFSNNTALNINRYPDERILRSLQNSRVAALADECLEQTEHWKHASTRGARGQSLEVPHNSVHVAMGWPMSSVAMAAFDPMFWLHHCNVDRIYEGYLAIEPDSRMEFEAYQKSLAEQDDSHENMFTKPLEPFRQPSGNSFYGIEHTFETQRVLHYKYDAIPQKKPQALKAAPTYVVFQRVKITQKDDMEGCSYQIHVFLVPLDTTDWEPPTDPDTWADQKNYAGMGAMFTRGSGCTNCQTRPPFNILIDVTAALERLNLTRHTAQIEVRCIAQHKEQQTIVQRRQTCLPDPVFNGPMFVTEEEHKKHESPVKDVEAVQIYLQKFGYYSGAIDGILGNMTEDAVKKIQSQLGMEQTGIITVDFKKRLTAAARCGCENCEDNSPTNIESSTTHVTLYGTPNYKGKSNVKYWLGTVPGYLQRLDVEVEIKKAFSEWTAATGIQFESAPNKDIAEVRIGWRGQSDNDPYPFDGPGYTVAHATKDTLYFDAAERWCIAPKEKQYRVFNVALHEIGHMLGLPHSSQPEALMAPFYDPSKNKLTAHDVEKVKALYA